MAADWRGCNAGKLLVHLVNCLWSKTQPSRIVQVGVLENLIEELADEQSQLCGSARCSWPQLPLAPTKLLELEAVKPFQNNLWALQANVARSHALAVARQDFTNVKAACVYTASAAMPRWTPLQRRHARSCVGVLLAFLHVHALTRCKAQTAYARDGWCASTSCCPLILYPAACIKNAMHDAKLPAQHLSRKLVSQARALP